MSEAATTDQSRSVVQNFFAHLLHMPRWHKRLLGLALLLLGGGILGQTAGYFGGPSAPQPSAERITPPGSSRAVDAPGRRPPPEQAEPSSSLVQRVSPWFTRVGFSFIAGFVIGWIVRAFVKTVVLIGSIGVLILAALSWFNVMNIDFSAAQTEYKSGITWLTDQSQRLGNAVLNHLPGSTSSFLGMFLGFRRR